MDEGPTPMIRQVRADTADERRNHRFEKRRGEIADIAARLFAERGYHGTSMQDLTDAIGLQRGAMYHYISAKKDLLYLIHDRFIQPLLAEVAEIERQNEPPDVALRNVALALVRTIFEQRDQVTVFLHEWRAIRDDEGWNDVRRARREFEAMVERTLQRGVDEGVFRIPELRLGTLGFLGMINWSYTWVNPTLAWDATQVADAFCDMFLHGVHPSVSPADEAGTPTRAPSVPRRPTRTDQR